MDADGTRLTNVPARSRLPLKSVICTAVTNDSPPQLRGHYGCGQPSAGYALGGLEWRNFNEIRTGLMAEVRDKNFTRGVAAMVVGLGLALAGALWAHFTGLPDVDEVGREIYPAIPRGWPWVLLGQLVSLGGVLLLMAGMTLAFLYEKKMTWARSAIGALLFTSLMMILFGVIPNEWLTYTQAVCEWTDQKIWIEIPPALLGGNEVNISASAFKDIIAGTYVLVVTVAVAAAMIAWQRRDEIQAAREKKRSDKKAVSTYGRPLQKVER